MDYCINVVGKFDAITSIGQHSRSFIDLISTNDQFINKLNFINTRPESNLKGLPKNVNIISSQNLHSYSLKEGISIFTDVLWNGIGDANYTKIPDSVIKLAYCVFESTKIPSEWVAIIENYFDAVLVPSECLIPIFKNSGISKPIFYLPLALDLAVLIDRKPRFFSKKFTFGSIGFLEERKNFHLLTEAFLKAFQLDSAHVQLTLRFSGYLEQSYYQKYFSNKKFSKTSSISISTGHYNRKEEYYDDLDSIDCYVALGGGEGYSIIPREALALGKPLLVAHAFAQEEICQSGIVQPVVCDIPVSAYYSQIHCKHLSFGTYSGIQFKPFLDDIISTLKVCYQNRHALYKDDLIAQRKEWAKNFSYKFLKRKYLTLIAPCTIELGEHNRIDDDKLVTNNKKLYSKYLFLQGKTKIYDIQESHSREKCKKITNKPKKVIILGHDGGFFSLFNRFMSYLVWELYEDPKAIVLPDWRPTQIKKIYGQGIKSFCYGKPEDGNIWLKLFKPLPFVDISEDVYNSDEGLYADGVLVDDFNEKREPLLTYIQEYELYKRKDFQEWRYWYHFYFRKYVRIRESILNEVECFSQQYFTNKIVIAAHVRHPSHAMEQINKTMPDVNLYIDKIHRLIKAKDFSNNNCVVFLATDHEATIQLFQKHFGRNLTFVSVVPRTTLEQDAHFSLLSREEQLCDGHRIQHRLALDPNNWDTRLAEQVIIDMLLLAKSHYLMHVTSNIATVVSYVNPQVNMIYCEERNKIWQLLKN